MARFPSKSLRSWLLLIILFALLPPMGLTTYSYFEYRRHYVTDAQKNAMRLARLAYVSQAQLIESAHQLLITLAKMPQVRIGDSKECSRLFADLLHDYPYFANLLVFTPAGDSFASALPLTQAINVADRPYFRRAMQTKKFVTGDYQICEITGKHVIPFTFPILDQHGLVLAVLSATLDLEWLNRLAVTLLFQSGAELPKDSAFTVRDSNGTIWARYPEPEKWVGKSVPEVPILKALLAQRGEGTAESIGVDGRRRFYAFVPMLAGQDTAEYVSVGIPVEVAFAEANRTFLYNLVGLAVIGSVVFALAWLSIDLCILRRVNALVKVTEQISSGNIRVRTLSAGSTYGSGELDKLAHSIDDMTEALELRAAQLAQSEAKYRTLVEQIPVVTYVAALDKLASTLYVSPQIEDLLGFSPEEWLADRELWNKQLHPEDKKRVMAELHRGTLEGFRSEYRMLTRDGCEVWIRDEATVVWDHEGEPQFRQGVMRDISERKQAEQERVCLVTAMEHVAESVIIGDGRGIIRYVNSAFERRCGLSRGEAIGRAIHSRGIDGKDEGFYEEIRSALSLGNGVMGQIHQGRKDGSTWAVETTVIPILDNTGKTISFVAVERDVAQDTASGCLAEKPEAPA